MKSPIMLYGMNSICVLYCLSAENRLNLASKYNMAAIIPLCITKKVLYQQSVTFLRWKSTSFEFIGVDVSQIFGLELWHQRVSLAGELVWLFVMTVRCKRTFFSLEGKWSWSLLGQYKVPHVTGNTRVMVARQKFLLFAV